MDLFAVKRDLLRSLAASIFALGIGGVLLLPALVGPWRLAAVVSGFFTLIAGALLSRNPRLFCLWGLMLALPMALSKHFDTILYKGGGEQSLRIELYDVFVGLLALYLVQDIIAGRIAGPRIPKVTWLWVMLMLMGCVTVVVGPWRTTAVHELVRMAKVILLFVVLTNELRSARRILHCVAPLAIGVLLQAAVGIGQWMRGDLLGLEILGETTTKTITNLAMTSVVGEQVFRPSALLLHANILGIFMATLLPMLIGAFLIKRGVLYRLFLLTAIAAGTVALILTQARGAWVSFALAFALMMGLMIAHRSLRRRSLLATGAAGVAVLGVVAAFSERIMTRLFGSQLAATVGREVFAADFKRLIADHWLFGTGLNNYAYEVRPYLSHSLSLYKNWVPPVHNIYYLWWAEQGLPGLALHMCMWGTIVWTGIQNLRVKDAILYTTNAACLAGMLAFAFDGLLSFSLRVNQPQRVFFLLSAIIFAIHYLRLRQGPSGAGSDGGLPEVAAGAASQSRRGLAGSDSE